MLTPLRTSIAVRSAAVTFAIVGLVGIGFLAVAVPLAKQREGEHQQAHLAELLDTVEHTVSIACYLSDRQLADEVAGGLLGNAIVRSVTIRAGGATLANRGKDEAAPDPAAMARQPGALIRRITSPFNGGEVVGDIVLVPDAGEIRRNVWQSSEFTAMLLLLQVAIAGIGVVFVVVRFIVRPISGLSERLHGLRAEAGEKLEVPPGNESDEIGRLVRDVNSMVDSLAGTLQDERALRLQREVEERKFRTIFEHANTGIFLIDEAGTVLSHNPAFEAFFGPVDAHAAVDLVSLLASVSGGHDEEVRAVIAQCFAEGTSMNWDVKLDAKSGTPSRWVNLMLSRVEEGRLEGVVNDVTERKRAEEAAQELAATDPLTGLGNRLRFERRIEEIIDDCYRHPRRRFAVLMVDLDWFKQVNDTYGHKAGDEVLIQIAHRLEDAVRKTDFVGRLGGDEFVVLLDSTSRAPVIERIAKKIIGSVSQPVPIGDGVTATIGASVGVAVFDDPSLTREELLRRADQAMYEAKRRGRNRYCLYDQHALAGSDPVPEPATAAQRGRR